MMTRDVGCSKGISSGECKGPGDGVAAVRGRARVAVASLEVAAVAAAAQIAAAVAAAIMTAEAMMSAACAQRHRRRRQRRLQR